MENENNPNDIRNPDIAVEVPESELPKVPLTDEAPPETQAEAPPASAAESASSTESTTPAATPLVDSINDIVGKTSLLLQNINNIKDELVKLDLNPLEVEYFQNSINPLLTILSQLSTTSINLSVSSNSLATNLASIVTPKSSRIKDTIHLIYDVNDECEDVFKELKKRINKLLKLC